MGRDKAGRSLRTARWALPRAQALNNWGLVLQELSAMEGNGGRERGALVAASVAKFRGAIRLRPEFDRACYNLGTVYYSHAHALQAAAQSALSSQLTKARRRRWAPRLFTGACLSVKRWWTAYSSMCLCYAQRVWMRDSSLYSDESSPTQSYTAACLRQVHGM